MSTQERIAHAHRPQRWDTPFGEMDDADVKEVLSRVSFASIDQSLFPDDISLKEIIKNDCRMRRYVPGDLIIREGDYGGSAFYIIDGNLRVVLNSLPEKLLGRKTIKKKGVFSALFNMGGNPIAEYRNLRESKALYSGNEIEVVNLYTAADANKVFPENTKTKQRELSDQYESVILGQDGLIGEIAALGRSQRTATIYAETEATVLEIRWQGLREIRAFDKDWRNRIDESYRKNMLGSILRKTSYFSDLDEEAFNEVAKNTTFESHGNFDWSQSYQSESDHKIGSSSEPVIAHEGDYSDSILVIAAGFARVSKKFGNGYQTLSYLKTGDVFGYDDLYEDWQTPSKHAKLNQTLSALGYVHILRVPVSALKKYVFSKKEVDSPSNGGVETIIPSAVDNALLEWVVEERFINGTKVMLIDQDRCVRCDDCVSACATSHDGNPRFIRHGKTFENWLVTNACMHCTDPVCMIGCPTGAIHRLGDGTVVINDVTCIGCATCANSCPYENIRMVEIRDDEGRTMIDKTTGNAIVKATKCDFCASQPGGPACVRACPHDALVRIDFQTQLPTSMKEL